MKRQLFIFFVCFFMSAITNAQTPAKWYYEVTPGSPLQLIVFESIGDTTINNQPCKILMTCEIESLEDSTGHLYWDTLTCPFQYTYYDSSKVYLFDLTKNNFDMLYNFNAVAGDTITVKDSTFAGYCPDGGSPDLFQYAVDSTNTVFVGIALREQFVSATQNATWSFYNNLPIIERIGSTKYLFGDDYINILEGEPYYLRCYEDTVITYVASKWPYLLPCDYLQPLSVNEVKNADYVISLSPNPATTQLIIQAPSLYNDEAVTVSIINVLGQKTSPPTPLQRRGESIVVDVSSLSAGIYFVQLTTAQERWVGRFVKE